MTDLTINFGDRLKSARKSAGLGQGDLAVLLGKTQSSVSQWERGESSLSLDVLTDVSKALGVSADWLLGIDDSALTTQISKRRKVTGIVLLSELSAALASEALTQSQIDLMADLLTQFLSHEHE